ncbi:MAG: LytTR family DNA-binding domain-containing protein [Eubacteriales bacterium]
MLQIGICDDVQKEVIATEELCQQYCQERSIEYECIFFTSGEEVIQYCGNIYNERIDVLFLDIEMGGISGIDLMEKVLNENKIWRIVYVSSHLESVLDSFSIKTMGFIQKPIIKDKVYDMLGKVMGDLEENIIVAMREEGKVMGPIYLDEVAYLQAQGSYTYIYYYSAKDGTCSSVISTKKLGELEQILQSKSLLRVHKSYLVNLANVVHMKNGVFLKNVECIIPIGRKYQEMTKKSYISYGRECMRRRL